MTLDDDACYRAIAGRDRRFEGRFVVAVRTTHVYCRPGCPAPLPKRKNVRFYACAAAAEEAGFRPCRRCRPESSPGTPAWVGTEATVARALRLIDAGALDDAGVDALADRLGIGARHLRRLFDEHLGASPLAIARTRRTHFARRLLDETDLRIAEVALASGFASLRRFNDTMRATFHAAPSALRRRAPVHRADGGLVLRLPFRPPLDYRALHAFLAARAIDGVEDAAGDEYRRTIRTREGELATIALRPAPDADALLLTVHAPPSADLVAIAQRARRIFDLDADPTAIAAHLASDRRMRGAARAVAKGLRVPGAWDPFELAVRAVLGQQVSVAGARTLASRLVRAFGETIPAPRGALTHAFPTPDAIAAADVRSIGLPASRAETIRGVARAVKSKSLVLDGSRPLDETAAALASLRGIGAWTAQYIAMRALGEPDAFPTGDLGLKKAWAKLDTSPLDESAESWRPWRAYAAMALWQTLETKENGK